MSQQCKKCDFSRKDSAFQNSSFLSSALVILIPKCPFCIMAYSSAISVCGGQSMYMESNNWVSFIPIILAVAVFVFIALNSRGRRTFVAKSVALVSILLILLSHQLIIESVYYDLGSIGLLISIWINGSLLHFSNFIANRISKIKNQFSSDRTIKYPLDLK